MSDIYIDNLTLTDFMRKLGYIWHGGLECLPTEAQLSALGIQKCKIENLQSIEPPYEVFDFEVLVNCATFIVLNYPNVTETGTDIIIKNYSKEYVWFMVKRHKKYYAQLVHEWCKNQKVRIRKKYFDVENGKLNELNKQKYLDRHSYFSTLQMLVCPYLKDDNKLEQNTNAPQDTTIEQ